GVRRTTLHAALAARAAQLDIPVLPVRVTGFTQHRGGVTAADVDARYLVAADGLHSGIRRACALDRPPARHVRFGLRRHYRTPPGPALVEVYGARGSGASVPPVAGARIGVAVLGGGGGDFSSRLAAFPALGERLAGAAPASDVRGAGPLRQDVRRRAAGAVLLVGAASGYLDALTGDGIGAALGHASALAGRGASRPAAASPRCAPRAHLTHPTRRNGARAQSPQSSSLHPAGLRGPRPHPRPPPHPAPPAARLPGLSPPLVTQVGQA